MFNNNITQWLDGTEMSNHWDLFKNELSHNLKNAVGIASIGNLVIQRITNSCQYVVPKAHNQHFKIICVGGGGGGYCNSSGSSGGGGSGYVKIIDAKLDEGSIHNVICGSGGDGAVVGADGYVASDARDACNGGETSFGNILFASGGQCGNAEKGGNGNAGGGGITGGDGGDYGGGGGSSNEGAMSKGGAYGGNGGSSSLSTPGRIFDGSILDVLFDISLLSGAPTTSCSTYQGCGGVGGNGGSGSTSSSIGISVGGGGGGYCGNGGSAYGYVCGGGGGYCGNGGSHSGYPLNTKSICGGGGGGFFCNGGDAYAVMSEYGASGGGGGFFDDGAPGRQVEVSGTYPAKKKLVGGSGGNGGVLIMYIKEG